MDAYSCRFIHRRPRGERRRVTEDDILFTILLAFLDSHRVGHFWLLSIELVIVRPSATS